MQKEAAITWALLSTMGFPQFFERLNGKRIHRLENVLTLNFMLHDLMDRMCLWFEKLDGKVNSFYQ